MPGATAIASRLYHAAGWWAPCDSVDFVGVPELKTVKNRVHLDVTTADVDALVAHGATVLSAPGDDLGWTVLADPEGNEFCAFTR